MDELKAKAVLKEVKNVLDKYNVEFWLNFGGLLGAVRDGRFISYDDDIELNAWQHKVNEQQMIDVSRDLCSRGYNVYYSMLTDYISIRKDNIPVAFSMYTLNDDKAERPHENVFKSGFSSRIARGIYALSEVFAITRVGKVNKEVLCDFKRIIKFLSVSMVKCLSDNIRKKIAVSLRYMSMKTGGEFGRTKIPAKYYLNLTDFDFYDMTLKVPEQTEDYLKLVYGPDWRIPLKDWNFYEHKSVTGIEITDETWDYCSG